MVSPPLSWGHHLPPQHAPLPALTKESESTGSLLLWVLSAHLRNVHIRVAALVGVPGKGRYPCRGAGVARCPSDAGVAAPAWRFPAAFSPAAFSSARAPSGATTEKFTRRKDRAGTGKAALSSGVALAVKAARRAAGSGDLPST